MTKYRSWLTLTINTTLLLLVVLVFLQSWQFIIFHFKESSLFCQFLTIILLLFAESQNKL